ncbi:proheparin-binding EGF-like growth factor isoform X2 [Cynoglossus semilaevis]|uniref:proheparin-binding EGF-like growth factor isoform X2 n=1 Tax=Cynoglossus semilaevis TaxID=244447 RepID=UPI00049685C1|nr:proheparin-binding EGF-like growth factor isoform X2 [Cynoglossus semilaevis]
MNTLIFTCLLCFVFYSTVSTERFETTYSTELTKATGGPAPGEGLQSLLGDDDELEADEELSGLDNEGFIPFEPRSGNDDKKKRKGKGKKKHKHRGKTTTPVNPEHTNFTSGYTSTSGTTEDPCTSTHLSYCIHGYCKHMEGVQEPVCICMKGYDGERCGIQTLESSKTNSGLSSDTELVQMVLVIIAVVLSVISCMAILLMTCAQSHKNYLASYLGTAAEEEKLQKPTAAAANVV